MDNEIITLKSGKEFETDYLVTIDNPNRMYVRIVNSSLMEVAAAFSNPDEVSLIKYQNLIIKGFHRLVSISFEEEAIKVSLAKGE